jgi:hypothetical protein
LPLFKSLLLYYDEGQGNEGKFFYLHSRAGDDNHDGKNRYYNKTYLASLELAIREFLASFCSRVLVLILPVVYHLSAAIEQQYLFALTNPCFTLKRSLELLPSILSGPEEVFSHRAAVATAEDLIN